MKRAQFELFIINFPSLIVLNFKNFVFDNVKNTRGTFKIMFKIYDSDFSKLVNGFKPLTINTNSSIVDVYQGCECATESTTKEEVP